eukprot:GHRQ01030772.1.p1 GENE.GHRQ01030772.1~~GHRQ01030772.1.p1  ORF type:complete len:160 (+),score=41.33 GHRQ01030772.1:268-747(+)
MVVLTLCCMPTTTLFSSQTLQSSSALRTYLALFKAQLLGDHAHNILQPPVLHSLWRVADNLRIIKLDALQQQQQQEQQQQQQKQRAMSSRSRQHQQRACNKHRAICGALQVYAGNPNRTYSAAIPTHMAALGPATNNLLAVLQLGDSAAHHNCNTAIHQ